MITEKFSIGHISKLFLIIQFITFGIQIWNSFFFIIHLLASVFPCNFFIKYDNDAWSMDCTINEKVINNSNNKNVIIGGIRYFALKSFHIYKPKN